MSNTISAPVPFQPIFLVMRRMRVNMRPKDIFLCAPGGFEPPNSTSKWPKTIGEIGRSHMESLLEQASHNAAGSIILSSIFLIAVLVDGIVYTDDCVFWLSKLNFGTFDQCAFVYRKTLSVSH